VRGQADRGRRKKKNKRYALAHAHSYRRCGGQADRGRRKKEKNDMRWLTHTATEQQTLHIRDRLAIAGRRGRGERTYVGEERADADRGQASPLAPP
jgi:hypothetical protein